MPILNDQVLRDAMRKLGLSQEKLATSAKRSTKTIWAALNRRPVSSKTHVSIANAVALDPAELLQNDIRPKVRDVSGNWKGHCHDIQVPTYFAYKIEPIRYEVTCALQQEGERVFGDCVVTGRFKSNVRVEGTARDSGNVIVLSYDNREAEFADFGAILLEYDGFGETLCGFFLGTERGHGTPFVLAKVELRRTKRARENRTSRSKPK